MIAFILYTLLRCKCAVADSKLRNDFGASFENHNHQIISWLHLDFVLNSAKPVKGDIFVSTWNKDEMKHRLSIDLCLYLVVARHYLPGRITFYVIFSPLRPNYRCNNICNRIFVIFESFFFFFNANTWHVTRIG